MEQPLELAPQKDLDAYAEAFGLPRDIVRLARKCPKCGEVILVPDNSVWLDAKPTQEEGALVMGIMQMGPLKMACSVNSGDIGSHHTIHEHQPPES